MMGPMNLTCLLNMDIEKVEASAAQLKKATKGRLFPLGGSGATIEDQILRPLGPTSQREDEGRVCPRRTRSHINLRHRD
jgi:hypothetical protein